MMGSYDGIPYALFKDDKNGFRHSIDKLIIDYDLVFIDFHQFCVQFSSESGFSFKDREEVGYNSFFDKRPSSSYGWFTSAFWFSHVNVKYGLYCRSRSLHQKVVDWQIKKVLRVEFNPNKCYQDPVFQALMRCIYFNCKVGFLLECDYAVDTTLRPSDIIVQSRKSRVLYDDSLYLGKRHTNGRIKVYNKTSEMRDKFKIKLCSEVTRCECTYLGNSEPCFSDIRFAGSPLGISCLSSNLRSIANLIVLAESYGEDRSDLLIRYVPDKRNRDKLRAAMIGVSEVNILCFMIFYDLLIQYAKLYGFWFCFLGPLGKTYNCPLPSGGISL